MTKEEMMRRAIVLSVDNVRNGGGPFGAVIIPQWRGGGNGRQPRNCQ